MQLYIPAVHICWFNSIKYHNVAPYSGGMHIIMLLVSGVSKLMGGSEQWAKVSVLKVGLLKQILIHVDI